MRVPLLSSDDARLGPSARERSAQHVQGGPPEHSEDDGSGGRPVGDDGS